MSDGFPRQVASGKWQVATHPLDYPSPILGTILKNPVGLYPFDGPHLFLPSAALLNKVVFWILTLSIPILFLHLFVSLSEEAILMYLLITSNTKICVPLIIIQNNI